MTVYEGSKVATGLKFAVVAARFNGLVTDALLAGALDTLKQHGAAEGDLDVFRCPGAFELPALARKVAETRRYDAVIALGCVIRGGTPHFDYICAEATRGLGQVALEATCAVTFGVLTCDTSEQAMERSGLKGGNKGAEAAIAAVEQANVLREARRLAKANLTAVKKR
jgi:6,7-dimethyl-8-ribityllumazine synthase